MLSTGILSPPSPLPLAKIRYETLIAIESDILGLGSINTYFNPLPTIVNSLNRQNACIK